MERAGNRVMFAIDTGPGWYRIRGAAGVGWGRVKRRRSLQFWIAIVFAVAVVSRIVDVNTGDTSPPPGAPPSAYHDSPFNTFAFLVFLATTVTFVALCVFAVSRWVSRRRAR